MNPPQQNIAMTTRTTTSFWNGLSENSPRKRINRADSRLMEGMKTFNEFKDVALNVEQVAILVTQYKVLCDRRERLRATATEQKQRLFSYSSALREDTAKFEAECTKWNREAQETTADLFANFMLEQFPDQVRAKQSAAQAGQTSEDKTSQPDDGPNPFADNISLLSFSTISSDRPLLPHEHHGFANPQYGGTSDHDWEDEESHRGPPPGGLGPLRDTGMQRGHWAP